MTIVVMRGRGKMLFYSSSAAVACIIGYLVFAAPDWSSSEDTIINMVTAGYVLLDMLLIIPTVFFIFALFSGLLNKGWFAILLGNVSFLCYDMFYAANYSSYTYGSIADLLWFIGLACFIYGLWNVVSSFAEVKKKLIVESENPHP